MTTGFRMLQEWRPRNRPDHIEIAVNPNIARWPLVMRKALWSYRVHPKSRTHKNERLWMVAQ